MIFTVGCAWAALVEADEEEARWLKSYLTFRSTVRGAVVEEPMCVVKGGVLRIPAGLVSTVVAKARSQGMVAIATNRSKVPFMLAPVRTTTVLRAHQQRALEKIQEFDGRCIINHCTGSGKGTLISYLCGALPNKRICVVVTSRRLALEMRARIESVTGEKPGVLGAGHNDKAGRILIVVENSLAKQTKAWFEQFEVVLGDEVHGVGSDRYYSSMMRFTNAPTRIGFSATFGERGDGRTAFVIGAFGPVAHKYTLEEAERDGVIAVSRLSMPSFWHPYHPVADGYTEWEKSAIAENLLRNQMLVRLTLSAKKPALLFVRLTSHAEILAEMLKAAGLKAEFAHGGLAVNELNKTLADLDKGKLDVVASAPILKQGVDLPAIKTVINASALKSTIDTIQKLGRGSRVTEGKMSFDAYDIFDVGCGCKAPTQHASCRWLEDHSTERRKDYIRFGFKIRSY